MAKDIRHKSLMPGSEAKLCQLNHGGDVTHRPYVDEEWLQLHSGLGWFPNHSIFVLVGISKMLAEGRS
jgi:hypothetical protein